MRATFLVIIFMATKEESERWKNKINKKCKVCNKLIWPQATYCPKHIPLPKYKKGTNHHNWKGKNAGYTSIHDWIKNRKGEANKCVLCNSKHLKYEWCNKDHKYRRLFKDWMMVCRSCHRKWDIKHNNYPSNLPNLKEKSENNI